MVLLERSAGWHSRGSPSSEQLPGGGALGDCCHLLALDRCCGAPSRP